MRRNIAQKTEVATDGAQRFFAPGDLVFARDYRGRELKRRVWAVGESVVYLCSEKLYIELIRGLSVGWPIGFPKRDVRPA